MLKFNSADPEYGERSTGTSTKTAPRADHLALPCRKLPQLYVKGLTIMVNSIYNGWRFEDVWLHR